LLRSELRSHSAASFVHLFRGEASVLFFPLLDACQTDPPFQRVARRRGQLR
jgi:hypothetical protein